MEKRAISEKLLEALRCFLNGEKVMWEDGISAEDWQMLFRLCQHHQILPMIYETVYACPAFQTCPQDTAQMVKTQVIRQVMVQSRKTEEFLQLYKKLLEQDLTPLVVKGLVCRELYREPDYRCSGDKDSGQSELFEAVQKLPRRYREAVHLYYYEGYSVKETAEILSLSETAVQTRLLRARRKLKEELQEAWK